MPDLGDVDFRSWLTKRTGANRDVASANYRSWFSTRISQGRVQGIAQRILSTKEAEKRADAVLEGQSAVILYSMLVYHFYPNMPSLKREIDSSPEHSANFRMLRDWFDKNNGKKIADDFYSEVRRLSGPPEAVV